MKTKNLKSVMGLCLMTIALGSLTGFSKSSVKTPMMCVADSYINAERYEHWTTGQRATWDVTEVLIGAGISALCPGVGLIYGL